MRFGTRMESLLLFSPLAKSYTNHKAVAPLEKESNNQFCIVSLWKACFVLWAWRFRTKSTNGGICIFQWNTLLSIVPNPHAARESIFVCLIITMHLSAQNLQPHFIFIFFFLAWHWKGFVYHPLFQVETLQKTWMCSHRAEIFSRAAEPKVLLLSWYL